MASDGARGQARAAYADGQVLQELVLELEKAQLALAMATAAGRADRSVARESLEKAQDLGAEVFRLRDQLKAARLDADESYSRLLDLEMRVRQEQARLAELQAQNELLGEHLGQALALHEQDGFRWQAELARVVEVHHQDTAVWQAEVERLQLKHQQEEVVLQAELDRVRADADDIARTLGEVLSSRSWRMTRGIRRVAERLHGRRSEELKVPTVGTPRGP